MENEEEEGNSLATRKFLASRIQEIKALTVKLGTDGSGSNTNSRGNGLAFQHVPKHMRRRAVSHNPKRLPNRLRAAHIAQVESSRKIRIKGQPIATTEKEKLGGDKPKKPFRRYRRKPSNLLLEYNRRQQRVKWLETHIWHARRFHVQNKWNYKIPVAPCEKGYRSLYRASRNGVTMRDISFKTCLEISGSDSLICEKFMQFIPREANGLSLGAVFYKTGQREAHMHFYKAGEYPFGYIGPVQLIWKPDLTKIWLWVHPAYKGEVLNEIICGLELLKVNPVDAPPSVPNKDGMKLEPKNLLVHPTWTNPSKTLTLVDLEGDLNRIRLYGPMSLDALQEVLKVRSSYEPCDTQEVDPSVLSVKRPPHWFEEFYEGKDNIVKNQTDVWNALNSEQGLPFRSVIPLTVRDPRVFLPQKRTKLGFMPGMKKKKELKEDNEKLKYREDSRELLEDYWKIASSSPLWEERWRHEARAQKLTDDQISKKRGEMLLPGSELDLGIAENQVPILLVNQSGIGIDLIIPAGWAMSFWVAFTYRCVHPYGLRDAIHFAFESDHLNSEDISAPDSSAGKKDLVTEGEKREQEYFGKPPTARTNLIRLSCPVPFRVKWESLLARWLPDISPEMRPKHPPLCLSNFYVLRDIRLMKNLSDLLRSANSPRRVNFSEFRNPELCLVPVKVSIQGRGCPGQDAMICLPVESDWEQLKTTRNFEYCEPDRQDKELVQRRLELRAKHKKFMAFLRKKRQKNRHQEIEPVYDSTETSRQYNEEMRKLWTPDTEFVTDYLTRVPFGYLTIGGERYSSGKSEFLGYVSLYGFGSYIRLASQHKNYVLVRDTRLSLIYRVGKITVLPLEF